MTIRRDKIGISNSVRSLKTPPKTSSVDRIGSTSRRKGQDAALPEVAPEADAPVARDEVVELALQDAALVVDVGGVLLDDLQRNVVLVRAAAAAEVEDRLLDGALEDEGLGLELGRIEELGLRDVARDAGDVDVDVDGLLLLGRFGDVVGQLVRTIAAADGGVGASVGLDSVVLVVT